MSKSTKRIIVIALGLLLLGVVSFGFFAFQVVNQGAQLMGQIETLQKERAQEESRLLLQKIAVETEADRAQIAAHFLEQESDSIDFLNLIEQIAPTVGVTLQTSGLEVIEDAKQKMSWIEADFSFSGEQADVYRFIKILETLPYVSRLMSVNLASQSEELWKAEVTMRVQFLEYDGAK